MLDVKRTQGELCGAMTVGHALRAARLQNQLSLKDVSFRLNISVNHLSYIEEEQFDKLPGSAYVTGFLRSYAQLVGLDSKAVIDQYRQLATQVAAPNYSRMPMTVRPPQRSAPAIASLVVMLAAVAYGGWYILDDAGGLRKAETPAVTSAADSRSAFDSQFGGEITMLEVAEQKADDISPEKPLTATPPDNIALLDGKDTPAVPLAKVSAKDPVQPAESGVAISGGGADRSKASSAKVVKNMPAMQSNAAVATLRDPAQEITIRAVAASWVEIIRSDGESVMTKLMRAGDSYVVDSSSKFYLSTGNAGGLVVILGDETPRPMGKSGEIIRDMPLISDKLRQTL